MSEAGFRVANIGCHRAGKRVLAGVSLVLQPGQAMILRGPNGAGKSSLLRVLAGLLPPSEGTARLNGWDLRESPEDYGAGLAYAGHQDALKPAFRFGEQLAFWAALDGASDPMARARAALVAMDLAHLADQPVHHGSAGQKRRLGLARLLVLQRSLWLLDEPTVSLDAKATAVFADQIRAHCAKGGMALIATHIDLGLTDAATLTLGTTRNAAGDDPFLWGLS